MGEPTTNTTPGQEEAPLNMFEGKMGRRQAIGGFLQLLGLKVAADATNAMAQDTGIAAVTKSTNVSPNTPKTDSIEKVSPQNPYEEELRMLRKFQTLPLSAELEFVYPGIGEKLEKVKVSIESKNTILQGEIVSMMNTIYKKIIPVLVSLQEKYNREYRGAKDLTIKERNKSDYDKVTGDLKKLGDLPGQYKSGELKPKDVIREMMHIVADHMGEKGLGPINTVPPSISGEVGFITKTAAELAEKLKKRKDADIAFNAAPEILSAPDTLRNIFSNDTNRTDTNIGKNLLGKKMWPIEDISTWNSNPKITFVRGQGVKIAIDRKEKAYTYARFELKDGTNPNKKISIDKRDNVGAISGYIVVMLKIKDGFAKNQDGREISIKEPLPSTAGIHNLNVDLNSLSANVAKGTKITGFTVDILAEQGGTPGNEGNNEAYLTIKGVSVEEIR